MLKTFGVQFSYIRMSRISEFSKTPEGQGEEDEQLPKVKAEIKSLQALSGVETISPKDL